MSRPDFSFEATWQARGSKRIAGVDEVGRGPLAGPVTAAAVVLDPDRIPEGLSDSKALSPSRRVALAAEIHEVAEVAIVHAEIDEIDRLNILHASEAAMGRAVAQLQPDAALIDGKRIPPGLACPAEAVVKGDARVASIAAASIVAKVMRDSIMVDLAQQYPGYGWERNAGYPTKEHLHALQTLGVTPVHRRSFAPVHKILYQGKTLST